MLIPSLLLVSLAYAQEAPKQVEFKLIPEQGSCGSGYKIETDESGALHIGFDELISEAKVGKYRASCRFGGEITIPRGYQLDPAVTLTGVVKGELQGGIDNVTGRLKFGLGRYISRDFQLAEYKEPDEKESKKQQSVKIELKAAVPEIPLNCTEDVRWPASLFIESTINGAAASRIEVLNLDGLLLVAGECPAPTQPSKR